MRSLFTLVLILSTYFVQAQTTVDFEEFTFPAEGYLNGSDMAGGFNSGTAFLPNSYNATYFFWSGWAISSTTDVTTPGFMNQYSAIAGKGYDQSSNYAVSFVSGESRIKLEGMAVGEAVNGFYVNNGTYAYLSMQNGDAYAKKFGGVTGDDPDFFLLTIKKWLGGDLSTDSVNFYLADYRFADNSQDYILDEWSWVDLNSLGQVDSLQFTLSSSDNGSFGMNTPAYFCMDNLVTSDGATSVKDLPSFNINVFPNPTSDFITIENLTNELLDYKIFSTTGQLMTYGATRHRIDFQSLIAGSYILEISDGSKVAREIILRK